MQDERIREDAKQLLRVAYEREVAGGDVGLGVDLPAAAEERGVDLMGVNARLMDPEVLSAARVRHSDGT